MWMLVVFCTLGTIFQSINLAVCESGNGVGFGNYGGGSTSGGSGGSGSSSNGRSSSGPYSRVESGSCDSVPGRVDIMDKTECGKAARDLGFSETTARERSYSYLPPGCSWCGGDLCYNPDSSSSASCSSVSEICLCKKSGNSGSNSGSSGSSSSKFACPADTYCTNDNGPNGCQGYCESCPAGKTAPSTSSFTSISSCKLARCSKNCPKAWQGDGSCDAGCNNAACNYDGGDCGGSRTPASSGGASSGTASYSKVKRGSCDSVSGRVDITNKAMCETAAGDLGLSETTASEVSSNFPPGCFWYKSRNLYYNTDSYSTTSCSSTYSCLCNTPRNRRRQLSNKLNLLATKMYSTIFLPFTKSNVAEDFETRHKTPTPIKHTSFINISQANYTNQTITIDNICDAWLGEKEIGFDAQRNFFSRIFSPFHEIRRMLNASAPAAYATSSDGSSSSMTGGSGTNGGNSNSSPCSFLPKTNYGSMIMGIIGAIFAAWIRDLLILRSMLDTSTIELESLIGIVPSEWSEPWACFLNNQVEANMALKLLRRYSRSYNR